MSEIRALGDEKLVLDGTEWIPGQQTDGTTFHAPASAFGGGRWIYGDGSAGDLVLHDGDLWVPGFYHDVTIEEGATVRVSPAAFVWPIYRVSGTFAINGTFDLSGTSAIDRNEGQSPLAAGSGVNGSQTVGETPETHFVVGDAILLDAVGTPVGGAGGDGAAGAGGVTPTIAYPAHLGPKSMFSVTATEMMNAPVGGASGGGDSTNYGGGGGGGGDWAIILCRHLVHGPNNLYLLNGGDGAPAGDDGTGTTGNGNCGGGGGGGGGYWMTISDTIDTQPAYITTVGNTDPTGTGGAGGAGCGTGTDGQSGGDGFGFHLLNT